MRRALPPACLGLLLAAAAGAQAPRVTLAPVACIPRDTHAPVRAESLTGAVESELRFYFRRQGYGDFYWVPARARDAQGGSGLLPLPEPDNLSAEVYAALYDAAGKPLAQSTVQTVAVRAECEGEAPAEEGDGTLVVGESSLAQKHRKIAWWRCEGVSERIDVHGERRPDESCAPQALWWERPELLAPFALLWGGGVTSVVIDEEPPRELSPVNP